MTIVLLLTLAVASALMLFRRPPIIKLIGSATLTGAGIAMMATAGWFPSLKEIANWLSGNIWLDGITLFSLGITISLWVGRLAVIIEYKLFWSDQSYDRYHKQGGWLHIRRASTVAALLFVCIQIAAYLTHLR